MFTSEFLRDSIKKNYYYVSRHADQERLKDNLTIPELEEALVSGCILEEYADTGRGLSCLVAGFTKVGKPLHLVCGVRGSELVLITVYIPTPPKFKTVYERG